MTIVVVWLGPEVLTDAAIRQRLRRFCKRRKSGKVPGGEDAHKLYQDMEKRDDMARMLVACGFAEAATIPT